MPETMTLKEQHGFGPDDDVAMLRIEVQYRDKNPVMTMVVRRTDLELPSSVMFERFAGPVIACMKAMMQADYDKLEASLKQ